MDNNKETHLEQKIKNLKIFQMFVLVIAIGAMALSVTVTSSLVEKINKNEQEMMQLEKRLGKMQSYLGYDESATEKGNEELANEFLSSEHVKTNTLGKETTKEDLFNLSKDSYYVLFYMNGCPHCIEVESKMQNYIDKDNALPVYFYNAINIDENTSIQWSKKDEPNYEPTVENFSLVGTPTLLKIANDDTTVFIGSDDIIEELGL